MALHERPSILDCCGAPDLWNAPACVVSEDVQAPVAQANMSPWAGVDPVKSGLIGPLSSILTQLVRGGGARGFNIDQVRLLQMTNEAAEIFQELFIHASHSRTSNLETLHTDLRIACRRPSAPS